MHNPISYLLLLAIPLALADKGSLDGQPTCTGNPEYVPNWHCSEACGQLANHFVTDKDTGSSGGCLVSLADIAGTDSTESKVHSISGGIAADACKQLANKCQKNFDLSSSFKASQAGLYGSGTVKITFDNATVQWPVVGG